MHTIPEMKPAEAQISEAEAAFQSFLGFRSRLDQNLPKHGSEREPSVVDGFSPAITKLIDVSGNSLRLTLETVTRAPTAALGQLVSLRNLTAQMAENAGRERALLGGTHWFTKQDQYCRRPEHCRVSWQSRPRMGHHLSDPQARGLVEKGRRRDRGRGEGVFPSLWRNA